MSVVAIAKMSLSDNFNGRGMGHGGCVRIMMLGCYTDWGGRVVTNWSRTKTHLRTKSQLQLEEYGLKKIKCSRVEELWRGLNWYCSFGGWHAKIHSRHLDQYHGCWTQPAKTYSWYQYSSSYSSITRMDVVHHLRKRYRFLALLGIKRDRPLTSVSWRSYNRNHIWGHSIKIRLQTAPLGRFDGTQYSS